MPLPTIRKIIKTVTKKITIYRKLQKCPCRSSQGGLGTMRLLWKDLFVGRSLSMVVSHRLIECSLDLEFTQNTESHDVASFFASWTGI